MQMMHEDEPAAKKSKENADVGSHEIFGLVSACILDQGLGKARAATFAKQVQKHGGVIEPGVSSETTHIVMQNGTRLEKVLKILKLQTLPPNVHFVNADWISQCLVQGRKVEENQYKLFGMPSEAGTSLPTLKSVSFKQDLESEEKLKVLATMPAWSVSKKGSPVKKPACSDSDSDSSFDQSPTSMETVGQCSREERVAKAWVCANPSSVKEATSSPNEYISEKLEVLAKAYTSTQDRWRALGYKKAIQSVRNYPKLLETYQEVSALPFVGERLAKKIWEIIETGHLRRLDHMDPKLIVINKFTEVWGAGPKTADYWYAQGCRTLEDVATRGNPTYQQQIGLKYYDDFLQKIPREEVEQIEASVKTQAEIVCPGAEVVVCGSYRRGRAFCGDIDMLLSHPDGRSHRGLLPLLLARLKEVTLITDDLVQVDDEEQRKYMGVCRLSGAGNKHRRIDFIVTPYSEWPLALLHFTGSSHLNRSMRQLAKTKNMYLSEHCLCKDVVRQAGKKVNLGVVVHVFSEKDVFRHLGLDYLEPTERDW